MCVVLGLPVVVENVPGLGRFGLLRPHLRHLLLCQQGEYGSGVASGLLVLAGRDDVRMLHRRCLVRKVASG